ncbi:MAG: hypothetical protein R3C49_05005 [Planctomycetaceae bacterium]
MKSARLNCQLWSLLIPLLLSEPLVNADEAANRSTLTWGNGDSLKGELVGAEGDVLTWKSSLFSDPLEVDLAVLSGIRFPEQEAEQPVESTDDFRVILKNGNVLHGQLMSVTNESFRFEGHQHGSFDVLRSDIRSLQRVRITA